MGIKNFFKKQLSTVVQWSDQQPGILFYKADTPTDEIKNDSKLIVAPGQGCLLVYEGKVEDEIRTPGTYLLSSDNHPFITTLAKLRTAFESEHKMALYFYRSAEVLAQGWGTVSPVKYKDPVYGFPVEMKAFGNYSFKIEKAAGVFSELTGSRSLFTVEDMQYVINGRIAPELATCLAASHYSFTEIDSHLSELSVQLKDRLNSLFSDLGLVITDFRIEAASFDEATQERIGKIADLTTENLAAKEVGLNYVELEKLRALRDAARNEGGLAGAGLQLGVGMEIGKEFNVSRDKVLDHNDSDPTVTLRRLKLLLDENIITEEEFNAKKKEILDKM